MPRVYSNYGKCGFRPSSVDCRIIKRACKNGQLDDRSRTVLDRFMNAPGGINGFDIQHGATPLHIAANVGAANVLCDLIEHYNAEVNAKDDDEWTPLHYAVYSGMFEIVYLLVNDYQANRQSTNTLGNTPSDLLDDTTHEDAEQIRLFLLYGEEPPSSASRSVTSLMLPRECSGDSWDSDLPTSKSRTSFELPVPEDRPESVSSASAASIDPAASFCGSVGTGTSNPPEQHDGLLISGSAASSYSGSVGRRNEKTYRATSHHSTKRPTRSRMPGIVKEFKQARAAVSQLVDYYNQSEQPIKEGDKSEENETDSDDDGTSSSGNGQSNASDSEDEDSDSTNEASDTDDEASEKDAMQHKLISSIPSLLSRSPHQPTNA
eukprot:gb/GECG01001951.1/.p1 GENE.gb/GECG01001951.1/~~gb/GECG01001951.1/.p1  ORF type:complete len:377 (+),score=58.59 gb/GECG01001951.1/:1-1131(+)